MERHKCSYCCNPHLFISITWGFSPNNKTIVTPSVKPWLLIRIQDQDQDYCKALLLHKRYYSLVTQHIKQLQWSANHQALILSDPFKSWGIPVWERKWKSDIFVVTVLQPGIVLTSDWPIINFLSNRKKLQHLDHRPPTQQDDNWFP